MKLADLKTPWANPETNLLAYCTQHYQYFKEFYRDFHEACEDELDFLLRLNHYINDRGNTRNKRVMLKGVELFHVHRHKVATICRSEPYIDCYSRDPDDDEAEDAAILMKHLVTNQFLDPIKRYSRNRRRLVSGALAARAWGLAVETKRGPDGKMGIKTRCIEPTRLMPHPGWADMHDPDCPSVMEEMILRTEDAVAIGMARKWKNLNKLLPDGVTPDVLFGVGRRTGRGIAFTGNAEHGAYMGEFTRIVEWLIREDHTKTYKNVRERARKKGEPTRMCEDCGATFGANEIAGTSAAPCPVCDTGMTIPVKYMEGEVEMTYPNGRMLVFAPDLNVVLFDGPWPYNTRAFPKILFTAYEHPREVFGQSEASLYWGLQVMLNRLRMFGYNQMMNSPDILIAPFNGLVDSKKRPYVHSDEQGRIAYFTNFAEAQAIKHFQGPGLPQAWSTLHGALTNDFTRTWGIGDLGMEQSSSRKIPVGTMQRMIENAELPSDDTVARLREEESVVWNVAGDLMYEIIKTEGAQQVIVNDDGTRTKQEINPETIRPVDFVLTGKPDMRMLRSEELDGFDKVMSRPPHLRRAAAKAFGIPMRIVRDVEREEMALAPPPMAAPPMPQPGAMPPPPEAGPAPPPWAMQMAGVM